MNPNDIIIKPIISEKSTALMENNKYVFKVSMGTNKILVKNAVKEIFGVDPKSVNILVARGKDKRVRFRVGRRSAFKKAIVTLKEGDKIDIFVGQ